MIVKSIKSDNAVKFVFILLPVICGLFTVIRYGVNVPFWDEWDFFINMDRFMTLEQLWEQHNEHRFFFPNIVSYITGSLTSWNSKALMLVSQMFLMMLYYVAVRIYTCGRKLTELSFRDTAVCVLLGFYIYNLRQYENMLWGFQTAWFMVVSLGALSFYLFDKYLKSGKKRFLIFSLCCAVIVTYSLMQGLMIWAAYVCIMIISLISKEKLPKAAYIAVSVTGALAVTIYFIGWQSVENHRNYMAASLLDIISFIPKLLFASVINVQNGVLAYIFFIITAALILICASRDIRASRFIANISIYGPEIMAAGMIFAISLGRGKFGFMSRYNTNGTFFMVFFILICIHTVRSFGETEGKEEKTPEKKQVKKYVPKICRYFPAVILSMSILSTAVDLSYMTSWLYNIEDAKYFIANYQISSRFDFRETCYQIDDENYNISEDDFRSLLARMDEKGWNLFAEDLSPLRSKPVGMPDLSGALPLPDGILNPMSLKCDYVSVNLDIGEEQIRLFGKEELSRAEYICIINGKAYSAGFLNGRVRMKMSNDILNEGENIAELFMISDGVKYLSEPYIFNNNGSIE